MSFDAGEMRVNGTPEFSIVQAAPTADYIQESVDLSAYAGNPAVTLDFRLFATTVVNRSGWYIDDVLVEYCADPNEIPTLGSASFASLMALMILVAGVMLRRRRRQGIG